MTTDQQRDISNFPWAFFYFITRQSKNARLKEKKKKPNQKVHRHLPKKPLTKTHSICLRLSIAWTSYPYRLLSVPLRSSCLAWLLDSSTPRSRSISAMALHSSRTRSTASMSLSPTPLTPSVSHDVARQHGFRIVFILCLFHALR